MRLSLPISLSLLLFAWRTACAQLADDYFNSGAQFYISNNIPVALRQVESGLKLYPDDVKLKKLEELLKQRQQQQQQRQQQQQQQNQQRQQNQKQQQQNQQNQQNKQSQQQQQQQSSQQPSKPSQGQSQDQVKEQQARAEAGHEMTPEEAKKLLDTQKGDEQFLQLKPKAPPEGQTKPIKDW